MFQDLESRVSDICPAVPGAWTFRNIFAKTKVTRLKFKVRGACFKVHGLEFPIIHHGWHRGAPSRSPRRRGARRRKAWIFRSWRRFSLRASSQRRRLRRQRASQLAPSIAILLLPARRGWLRLFSRTQSWTARWPNRSTSSARIMGLEW